MRIWLLGLGLAGVVGLFGGSAIAQPASWVKVGENARSSFYVDVDSIRYENGQVRYRSGFLFAKPRPNGRIGIGVEELASCTTRRSVVKTVADIYPNQIKILKTNIAQVVLPRQIREQVITESCSYFIDGQTDTFIGSLLAD